MRGSFFGPSFGSFFESFEAGNETIIAGDAGFGNCEQEKGWVVAKKIAYRAQSATRLIQKHGPDR